MRLLPFAALALFVSTAQAARPDVAVVISDDIEPYTAPVKAFEDALGLPVQTVNIHGRESEAEIEIETLRESDPKVVFALGAKAAYAIRNRMPNTPMVYAQVMEPARYGLPGPQVTGISTLVPPVTYLSQMASFFPEVREIGVLRGPNMADGDLLALQAAAVELDINLDIRKVTTPREMRRAFNDLAPKVDGIWISPDRQALTPEGFRSMTEETRRRHLPMMVTTDNMVRAGGLFAVVPNPEGVGRQAAEVAKKLLEGAAPSIIPVQDPEELLVALNKGTLERAEVPFEALMLDFVDIVIE